MSIIVAIFIILVIILSIFLFLIYQYNNILLINNNTNAKQFRVQKIDTSPIFSTLSYRWEARHDPDSGTAHDNLHRLVFSDGSIPLLEERVYPNLIDMVHFDDGKQYIRNFDMARTQKIRIEPSRWGIIDDVFRRSQNPNRVVIMQSNENLKGKQLYIINNFYIVSNLINQIYGLRDNSYFKYTLKRSLLVIPNDGVVFEGIDTKNKSLILYPGDGLILTLISRNRWRVTRYFNKRNMDITDINTPPQFSSYTSTLRTPTRR